MLDTLSYTITIICVKVECLHLVSLRCKETKEQSSRNKFSKLCRTNTEDIEIKRLQNLTPAYVPNVYFKGIATNRKRHTHARTHTSWTKTEKRTYTDCSSALSLKWMRKLCLGSSRPYCRIHHPFLPGARQRQKSIDSSLAQVHYRRVTSESEKLRLKSIFRP